MNSVINFSFHMPAVSLSHLFTILFPALSNQKIRNWTDRKKKITYSLAILRPTQIFEIIA